MKVTFEKYNPLWTASFASLETELKTYLSDFDVRIEHIGSTSVKNLSAKPIIDIMIGVKDPEDLDKIPDLLMRICRTEDFLYDFISLPEVWGYLYILLL